MTVGGSNRDSKILTRCGRVWFADHSPQDLESMEASRKRPFTNYVINLSYAAATDLRPTSSTHYFAKLAALQSARRSHRLLLTRSFARCGIRACVLSAGPLNSEERKA